MIKKIASMNKPSADLPIYRFTRSPLHRKDGFTLIEIAMVLIIVGLTLTSDTRFDTIELR